MHKRKPVRRLYSESTTVSPISPKPSVLQKTLSHSLYGVRSTGTAYQLPLAQGLTESQSRCQPGLLSHLKLNWGRSHIHAHSCGRIQFLMDCGTEHFSSLMTIAGGFPQFLVMWGSPGQLTDGSWLPAEQVCERGRANWKPESSCNHLRNVIPSFSLYFID